MVLRRFRPLALCLCLLLCAGCSNDGASGGERSAALSTPSAEPTPPPVTVETVRAALPGDVDPEQSGADAIACACYFEYLSADEGLFRPDELATLDDAAAAVLRMSSLEVVDADEDGEMVTAATESEVMVMVTDAAEDGDGGEGWLTRRELADMLWQCAGRMGWTSDGEASLENYLDGDDLSETGLEPLLWCAGAGVFRGLVGNYLLPDFPVTRSQLAQALVCLKALDPEAEPAFSQSAESCQAKAAAGISVAQADKIQAAMELSAKTYGAEGIQVAVVENGVVTASFASGWATKDTDPMTVDHKERVASISKVVLGMAAMALSEDGVVDLNESIGSYWGCAVGSSSYPDDPVCIDTILTHTSTIPMASNVSYSYDAVKARISSGTTGGRPGDMACWGYNNYAFEVLGMTLELAAGETIDPLLDRYFFDVLDIDAAYRPSLIEAQDKLVNIYDYSGNLSRSIERQRQVGQSSVDSPGAEGGMFCGGLTISAKDLAKMLAILAGDGSLEGVRFLSQDSVAHMEERLGQTSSGFWQCYPLRYQENMYGRAEIYYHTGSAWGVYNCMSYDPATGDGVVVLTSGASSVRDDYGVYAVCGEISQMVYDLLAEG